MKKEDILVVDGTADSWEQAIHLAGGTLYENGFVKEGFEQACIDREKTYPTGLLMDTSIAIPHTDDQFVIKAGVCILRLKEPVDFYRMDAPDFDSAKNNCSSIEHRIYTPVHGTRNRRLTEDVCEIFTL